jgi:hypothetical protein
MKPGVRYHAAVATAPSGEMAMAIAHMEPEGAVLDEIRLVTVTGGDAGIDAVYRGLRAQGIEVCDHRRREPPERRSGDVQARAIADALELARAH